MPFITFGNDEPAVASIDSERSALVSDLRSAFDLLDRLGVRRQVCGSKAARAGLLFTAAGTGLLMRSLGLPNSLRVLAMLNTMSEKHKGYLAKLEGNKAERMRLRGQMLTAFADVKPMKPAEALAARGAPEAAASASVMGAWGTLILAGAAAGAGIYCAVRWLFRGKKAPEMALLGYFKARRMRQTTFDEDKAAAALAASMNLPRTAVSIADNQGLSGLPRNENWPKTAIPVTTYVAAWLDINAPVAKRKEAEAVSGSRSEEDMSGVSRAGRARLNQPRPNLARPNLARQNKRLARVSPATAPGARNPSLVRLTMPELLVQSGSVRKVMPKVSPGLGDIMRSLQAWKVSSESFRKL